METKPVCTCFEVGKTWRYNKLLRKRIFDHDEKCPNKPNPLPNVHAQRSKALEIASQYAHVTDAAEKTWVIDQMVRALWEGSDDGYRQWTRAGCEWGVQPDDFDSEVWDEYVWDQGTAPKQRFAL